MRLSIPPPSHHQHFLLLFFTFFLVKISSCEQQCPSLGPQVANKSCPAFKDDPNATFCCLSKLRSASGTKERTYFCCPEKEFEKQKKEAADAEFRNFFKEYLALVIFGTVLVLSLGVIFMAIICKKIPGCPMYRNMHMMSRPTDSPAALYRPVDQIPPKMYEAPPPYECFVPPPSTTPSTQQTTSASSDSNDWNCILENEVNNSRREPPQVS